MRLWVSLGCSIEEKSNLQPVDIDIKVVFLDEPFGCQSDQLSHVLCYKMIVERITEALQNRSFNLIEFLAAFIFDAVSHHLTHQDQQVSMIELAIAKPNHPVMNVHGAMTFKYCRRLPQTSL